MTLRNVLTLAAALAFTIPAPAADQVSALRDALTSWRADAGNSDFQYALTDLNDDGQPDAVVLMSADWCGSGGCTLVILKGDKSSFSFLSQVTLVHEPIGVLPSKLDGWHTLTVTVGGGGLKGGVAILPFKGEKYARNPSLTRRATASERAASKQLVLTFSKGDP